MRLKSLKLAGFKSFANPVTFTFKKNITAIVGPNGCGKSNVIDAIRWVLGESSAKQLRGGNMADVIFAGANGKAARSMASVELTFEHTQDSDTGIRHALNLYQELSLRRQISSDGKSDYFINGQRVRRRDVVDVFLGTGLSARSYAVIEQGMIGRIIEADGVRLREFIEESAGVSRYQARRLETQKQLALAKDNLNRLNDLQSELLKQQKSLSQQAKSASEYQILKDRLTDIENELLMYRLFEAWQAHQSHTQDTKALMAEKNALDAKIGTLQKDIDTHRQHLDEVAHLKEATAFDQHQKALELQSAKHAWDKAVADKQAATDTLERLTYEHKLAQDAVHTHAKDVQTHTEAIAKIESQLSALEEDIYRKKQAKDELDDSHHAFKAKVADLITKEQSLASTLAIAKAGHKRLQSELDKWVIKHNKARALIDGEQPDSQDLTDLAGLQQTIKSLAAQIETLQEDIEEDKPVLLAYEKNTAAIQERLVALEKTHARLSSEYDTLHRLVYPPAVAKKDPSTDDGITLVDELSLTKLGQRHTQILDIVLKPMLNDKAVETVLLPLINQQPRTLWQIANTPSPLVSKDGAIVLSELIKTPALALWQQMYLLTELDDPLSHIPNEQMLYEYLTVRYGQAVGFVLKTGAIVHRYGVFVPSVDKVDGFLSIRKAHLDRLGVLEDELLAIETNIAHHTKELATAKQHYSEKKQQNADYTALLTSKMYELSVLQKQHAKLEQIRQSQAQTLSYAHQTLKVLDEEKGELDDELAKVGQIIEQTQKQLDKLTPSLDKAKTDLSLHQDRQYETKKALSALYDDRQRLSMSLTHHKQSRQYAIQTQNNAQNAGIHRQNTIQTQQKTLEGLSEKLPVLERAYLALQKEHTALEDKLSTYKKEHEQAQHTIKQLQNTFNEHQKTLTKNRDTLAKYSTDTAVALARMQDLSDNLKERDGTFNLAKQLGLFETVGFSPSKPIGDLTQEQKSLIKRQSALGAVNLSAKAKLDELNDRLAPMSKEMTDVQASIETLQGAIDTIDQKTKGLFMATLTAVNKELNALFSKVFGGGQASLTLSDDEGLSKSDKWRAGLTLMAQPKGKKNSRLAVLSGGEKTLTALSLIFAIFKQHPAPFCVLDEVDAPLDDANVERFTSLINELACDVQFIFISHNKLAMQIAGELKGVTMPVAGISSLVSVSLDEAQGMIG